LGIHSSLGQGKDWGGSISKAHIATEFLLGDTNTGTGELESFFEAIICTMAWAASNKRGQSWEYMGQQNVNPLDSSNDNQSAHCLWGVLELLDSSFFSSVQ
jgi:hypothetical protein